MRNLRVVPRGVPDPSASSARGREPFLTLNIHSRALVDPLRSPINLLSALVILFAVARLDLANSMTL
jgi:hypothetical protein